MKVREEKIRMDGGGESRSEGEGGELRKAGEGGELRREGEGGKVRRKVREEKQGGHFSEKKYLHRFA